MVGQSLKVSLPTVSPCKIPRGGKKNKPFKVQKVMSH